MADRSLAYLTAVVAFFTLATSVTGVFLPNYYLSVGLSPNQIVALFAIAFLTLGLVPVLTLRFMPRSFERLLVAGLILNVLFYIMLIYVRNPFALGFASGLSQATYWPALNLLMFRLTNVKRRGIVFAMLSVVVPTITSIIGPLLGGFLIDFFTFNVLFVLSIALLLLAMICSLKIGYEPVDDGFAVPSGRLLLLFALLFIIAGWVSSPIDIMYPLFLHQLTGSFLNMGIVAAILSVVFAAVSLVAGKISEIQRHRITFAFLGAFMASVWVMSLGFVQNVLQLVGVSVFNGISGAFVIMLVAIYGDFFKRKQHAMLVVLIEVFRNIGQVANLVPVYIFIGSLNFRAYFLVTGVVGLGVIPIFLMLRRMHHAGDIKTDAAQS